MDLRQLLNPIDSRQRFGPEYVEKQWDQDDHVSTEGCGLPCSAIVHSFADC